MDDRADERPHEVEFHPGELRLQEYFDERVKAERIAFSLRRGFVERTSRSLQGMTMLALTIRNGDALDIHLLSGPPGFLTARDARKLAVTPEHRLPADLVELCGDGAVVGTTGIDFDIGARVRANGFAHVEDQTTLVIETDEVFPNCKSHVEPRYVVAAGSDPEPLDGEDDIQRFVAGAELLFIATETGDGSALDVAHRAGPPGFVELHQRVLRYEDYFGNGMYQSLGNLDLHPRASVAVLDLDAGQGIIVRGSTRLETSPDRARRWVAVDVDSIEPAAMPPRRMRRHPSHDDG